MAQLPLPTWRTTVATIAANNGGETVYTDANILTVGSVTVAGMTITGITTTNDDVKLTVDNGNLDISDALALGTGDLLLDVTGDVTQSAAITASGLALMVDGTTTLNNAANNVATIAANNGGETQYTDAKRTRCWYCYCRRHDSDRHCNDH